MSDASIAAALMAHASIAALVGTRVALVQLPQGTAMPALVYQPISNIAKPYLGAWKDPGKVTLRLQINPLAKTVNEIIAIHAAVRAVCMRLHGQTVAGHHIIHSEEAGMSGYDKDNDTGSWTRAADYLITYEDE